MKENSKVTRLYDYATLDDFIEMYEQQLTQLKLWKKQGVQLDLENTVVYAEFFIKI